MSRDGMVASSSSRRVGLETPKGYVVDDRPARDCRLLVADEMIFVHEKGLCTFMDA